MRRESEFRHLPQMILYNRTPHTPPKRSTAILSPRVVIAATAVAFFLAATAPAFADQTYDVSGVDQYRVGTSAETTHIAYAGAQKLSIDRSGGQTRYTADVRYTRVDESGKASVRARFVQALVAGEFQDRSDDDPDFLTILNQPFAIQLDPVTMRDLRAMRTKVPFAASSPFGGSSLKGFLRPSPGGKLGGHRVVGVRFTANGPMSGAIPDKSLTSVSGTINMDGTAFYALDTALLLGLDATLTISGNIVDKDKRVPVTIVYRRSIRASDSTNAWSAAEATPQNR